MEPTGEKKMCFSCCCCCQTYTYVLFVEDNKRKLKETTKKNRNVSTVNENNNRLKTNEKKKNFCSKCVAKEKIRTIQMKTTPMAVDTYLSEWMKWERNEQKSGENM